MGLFVEYASLAFWGYFTLLCSHQFYVLVYKMRTIHDESVVEPNVQSRKIGQAYRIKILAKMGHYSGPGPQILQNFLIF